MAGIEIDRSFEVFGGVLFSPSLLSSSYLLGNVTMELEYNVIV